MQLYVDSIKPGVAQPSIDHFWTNVIRYYFVVENFRTEKHVYTDKQTPGPGRQRQTRKVAHSSGRAGQELHPRRPAHQLGRWL